MGHNGICHSDLSRHKILAGVECHLSLQTLPRELLALIVCKASRSGWVSSVQVGSGIPLTGPPLPKSTKPLKQCSRNPVSQMVKYLLTWHLKWGERLDWANWVGVQFTSGESDRSTSCLRPEICVEVSTLGSLTFADPQPLSGKCYVLLPQRPYSFSVTA
jgi:hypothetical protein